MKLRPLHSLMPLALMALPCGFMACGDSGPDGWFIISNPSGNGLTAGVVKSGENSTMSLVETPGGSEVFVLHNKLADGMREQYYAVGSDLVLSKYPDGLVVESPAFPLGRRRFPSGTVMQLGSDSATLIQLQYRQPDGSTSETWWLSGWSNLILRQDQRGLTIYRENQPPQPLAPGAQVSPRGKSYEIADNRGKLTLLQPGQPPEPEQRMAYVASRKAVQFFDAKGRVVAELPAKGIEIAPEGQAFFLTGKYPDGLPGISRRPLSVLVPRHNRHLILLTH